MAAGHPSKNQVAETSEQPNTPGRRVDRVASTLDSLTDEIVSGEMSPGEELPAEGELAQRFGVSRTVIREAMRELRVLGLVEVSQGKVARVKASGPESAVTTLRLLLRRNEASLSSLVEVRQPLEGEIAALAADRAYPEHLRQLQRAIDDHAAARDVEGRVEADVRFHRILGEATGNPVFVVLLETLGELMRESRKKTLARSGVEQALEDHRNILAAVRSNDGLQARMAMLEHLKMAARDLEPLSDSIETKTNDS